MMIRSSFPSSALERAALLLVGLTVAGGATACSGDAEPSSSSDVQRSAPRDTGGEADDAPDAPDAGNPRTTDPSSTPDAGEGDAGRSPVGEYTSIVALDNCSGSLVRFVRSKPDDRAMVLTNGHCYEGGFIDNQTAVAGRPSKRRFRLLNSDATADLGGLTASRVLYGTMTGTDLLLYELTETFREVTAKYKVDALTMAERRPDAREAIRIPSGYWRRLYSCNIDTFVYGLQEGPWVFRDSIKYSEPGCETIGGTSGSPILRASTREVIGVNNTGNESGDRCTQNNPCEVDDKGTMTVDKGASYGQQTFWVYGCLTEANTFDFAKPGCQLTKP